MTARIPRGLSLLEIVISITILVVVFFTTYQIFMLGFRGYRTSQYSTELMKLAQGRLEDIVTDRNPNGPQRIDPYVSFSDPRYMYKVDWDFYNTTASSGFEPSSGSHTPYNLTPNYDLYVITFYAKGPMEPDGSDGSLTKTIVLKSIVAPVINFAPEKCSRDENNSSGASSIWTPEVNLSHE